MSIRKRGHPGCPCCGGGGGGSTIPCSPCDIPTSTLTLNYWYYTTPSSQNGPASVPLLFIPGPNIWDSGIVAVPPDSYAASLGVITMRVQLYCAGAFTGIDIALYTSAGPFPIGVSTAYITGATCTPYSLTLDETGCCIGFFHHGTIS